MKQDTVIVREIYQHRLEDALSKGKVLLICFDDGEIKYVTKYKEERHYIQFEDGEIRDLYVILNNIQYYKLAVDKNDEPKKNTANKSTTKKQATKKIFSIYSLAKGKPGKKYTIKQFLDIYKKSEKREPPNPKFEIPLEDGYVYKGDSNEEKTAINNLIKHDSFKRLRGQAPGIEYYYKGKYHTYFPDFFIITNSNKIIIIEIKQIAQMNSGENKAKYNALKKYCKAKKFLYVMCDKTFSSFESLKDRKGSTKVEEAIEAAIDEKGCFDYDDYLELTDELTYKKIKWMRKAIGIYVASHKNVVMYGDLTYKIKKLKIKQKQ